jgi:hypothetical protein
MIEVQYAWTIRYIQDYIDETATPDAEDML